MSSVVLATAGHIDHGKTELTRALTGIDTDRLPEEKARGITIDLGFAHLRLGERDVAVIDVPGHERFVRNMLAGVGGIDLALVVVAADESLMPQTREHLAILELLGVRSGVIAVNKSDLVDGEMLELVHLEIAEAVRGTGLEDAAVVDVSARTGAGVDALRDAIAEAVATVAQRDLSGPFRMHVDRCFSVRGFGSVVTGTVISGGIAVGADVAIVPGERQAKIRGIEVHGREVGSAAAGSRAALNLGGVTVGEIARGDQLVEPGLFRATSLLDVRLRMLESDVASVRDLGRVRVHLGSAEVLARARLLGGAEELVPGATGYAQLRLERPLLAWPGDRFIVRRYSPITTIGGGVVVDLPPNKHRGRSSLVPERLRALDGATFAGRVGLLAEVAGDTGTTLLELVARTGAQPAQVRAALAEHPELIVVDGATVRVFGRASWAELGDRACALLQAHHAREPLLAGMSRQELRTRLRSDAAAARRLLDDLVANGRARLDGELVALASHAITLTEGERQGKQALEASYLAAGFNPPTVKESLRTVGEGGEQLLALLQREGILVAIQQGQLLLHRDALARLKQLLREKVGDGQPVSVATFKELTGTSRKHAIPLLEYLDGVRFTRRHGDDRVLVGPEP